MQERKRLISNRNARDLGRHFVNPIRDTDTHLTCAWCDYTAVVGQLSKWIGHGIESRCFGNSAPRERLIELHKRNETIRQHDNTATAQGKHFIRPLEVASEWIVCTACGEDTELSGTALYSFQKEQCLALPCTDAQKRTAKASRAAGYKRLGLA